MNTYDENIKSLPNRLSVHQVKYPFDLDDYNRMIIKNDDDSVNDNNNAYVNIAQKLLQSFKDNMNYGCFVIKLRQGYRFWRIQEHAIDNFMYVLKLKGYDVSVRTYCEKDEMYDAEDHYLVINVTKGSLQGGHAKPSKL